MSCSASEISISPIPLPELTLSQTFAARLIESIVSSVSHANGLQCWHEASQTQKDGLPLRSLLTAFTHSARFEYLEMMRCLWQHAQTRAALPNICPEHSPPGILVISAFPAAIQAESLESINLLWAFAGELNLQQHMLQAECEEGLYQPFIIALNANRTETAVHLLTLAYTLNDGESTFDAMLAQITDETMRENLRNHTIEAYQTNIAAHHKRMTDRAHGMPTDVNSLCAKYVFGFFTPWQSEETQRNDPKAAAANI